MMLFGSLVTAFGAIAAIAEFFSSRGIGAAFLTIGLTTVVFIVVAWYLSHLTLGESRLNSALARKALHLLDAGSFLGRSTGIMQAWQRPLRGVPQMLK